jgi:hypothetical protein
MPRTKNAFFNRIHVRAGLVIALVGGIPIVSYAGYAYPSTPSGFSGSAGAYKYQASANDAIGHGIVRTAQGVAVNAGGRAVTIPVAMRFAANTGRYAAAGLNPWFAAGIILLPPVIDWMNSGGFKFENGQLKKTDPTVCTVGPCYYYSGSNQLAYLGDQRFSSASALCEAYSVAFNASNTSTKSEGVAECGGVSNFYVKLKLVSGSTHYIDSAKPFFRYPDTPKSTVWVPATPQEFEDGMAPKPLPDSLPKALPFPLPVEQPIINPEPGENPQPRPFFVPTGDPVPNPNYDPNSAPGPNNQPWIQPGVRVQPSPTPSEPWRVDVQPVNRPQAGSEPLPDSQPDPENPDKPKPEEQQSLCEKHPDILACQKPDLDTPEVEIPKSNKDVSLQEENLFGGGSCPVDVYFTPHGLQQLKVWDWNQSCGYITGYVKPILIICCTFAAFMILIPGRTE